jgi:cyanophycinase-like exopeptidase
MTGLGGWLCLQGGGEFSVGETEEADRAWLEKTPPGPVGFVPAASGSADYGRHFAEYLGQEFGREVETIPIYRDRDARRARNVERLGAAAAVYLGGGVADHLLDALAGSPAAQALSAKLQGGGVVVAIAAAAQACGAAARSVSGGRPIPGLGLLPDVVVETNFDPGHDRRLRQLLEASGARRGIGIAAGAALLIGPEGRFEAVGGLFTLASAEGDLVPMTGEE